jgi:hypothetical protein
VCQESGSRTEKARQYKYKYIGISSSASSSRAIYKPAVSEFGNRYTCSSWLRILRAYCSLNACRLSVRWKSTSNAHRSLASRPLFLQPCTWSLDNVKSGRTLVALSKSSRPNSECTKISQISWRWRRKHELLEHVFNFQIPCHRSWSSENHLSEPKPLKTDQCKVRKTNSNSVGECHKNLVEN